MAKMFYSAAEAAQKLGTTEDGVKDLVKEGKLREFRDAGSVNYKVDDVDKMAGAMKKPSPAASSSSAARSAASDSSAAEIVLEPAESEDSGIEIAGGSDILSLEDLDIDSGGTSAGTKAGPAKKKGDSAVASVGVSVFDDDIDEHVDPLAQTAVTDLAGLALEGSGVGSGIMDLTRESDDTSLGQELLDEIYTGDESPRKADVDDTRAGMEVADEAPEGMEDEESVTMPVAPSRSSAQAAMSMAAMETVSDPVSTSLTAMMVVVVAVLWFAGLGAAALVRGITPGLLQWVYGKLALAAIGAVVVGLLATAVTYLLAKRAKS